MTAPQPTSPQAASPQSALAQATLSASLRQLRRRYFDKNTTEPIRHVLLEDAAARFRDALEELDDLIVATFGYAPTAPQLVSRGRFDVTVSGCLRLYTEAGSVSAALSLAASLASLPGNDPFADAISVAPLLTAGIRVLSERALSAGVPLVEKRKLYLPPIVAIVVGFVFLGIMGSTRDSAVKADLAGHTRLASMAVDSATRRLQSADSWLNALATSPDSLRGRQHAVEDALIATHGLDATALDALNRVQQVGHQTTQNFDSRVTVRLSEANALADLLRSANERLFHLPPKASTSDWAAAAADYDVVLTEETSSLKSALGVLDTMQVGSVRTVIADAVMGRTPSEFVVKLFYAVTFVLIGGGILFVLGRIVGVIDSKTTIQAIVDRSAADGSRTTSAIWPLLAPLGLVTGLVGGYSLATPSGPTIEKAPETSHHVILSTQGDSSRLVDLRAAIGDIKESVQYVRLKTDTIRSVTDAIQQKAK